LVLVIVLAVCLVSCKSGKADVSGPAAEVAEVPPVEGGEKEEAASVPAALVLDMSEGPDTILDAYRNPRLRDGVVLFFQNLTGSQNVAQVVLSNADSFDIAPALAFALCWEESRYDARAFNRNRNNTVDRGLFQLNSATFPKLKLDDFYNPEINAWHGLAHLRWCMDTAGTEVAALAMYNAGTARVRSAGTPKNTLDYISRILKRQRKIEELFMAEFPNISRTESVAAEAPARTPFRLSLLTPLGRN